MNILILRNILIFTLLILGQQSFAQSINDANFQKILTENPSILNNIPQQDKTTFNDKLISENQNVANTENNLPIDLFQASDQIKVNEKWVTIEKGTTIGKKRLIKFKPLIIKDLRFTIVDSKDVQLISEIGLYKSSQ